MWSLAWNFGSDCFGRRPRFVSVTILLDIFNTQVKRDEDAPAVLGGNFKLPLKLTNS